MQISNPTEQDGKFCAQLINLLKLGRWELSGPDIAAHSQTVQWVISVAQQIGSGLQLAAGKPGAAAANDVPPGQFRISSVGISPVPTQKLQKSIPGGNSSKGSRSRKK